MSQTGQGTSSTSQAASSISNIQSITNAALADYATITGIDLSNDTFNPSLEQANSPEAILQLLQERENVFKDYREGNRRLFRSLSPSVNMIQTFSRILGNADEVSHKDDLTTLFNRLRQVPFPLANALFGGIYALLAVRPSNELFIRFLCDV